jgi:squalene cyclase
MLAKIFERCGTTLADTVHAGLEYLRHNQFADGSITPALETPVFKYWDAVNALKAISLWQQPLGLDYGDVVDPLLAFLKASEKPNGLLGPGVVVPSSPQYSGETSWEYIACLARLGLHEQKQRKLDVLLRRQLPEGPWEEAYTYIPKAFQRVPSVTGFALSALSEMDEEPIYLDEALNFLVGAQHPEGHFGLNWYYYNSHFYLTRPITGALAAYGCHSTIAAVRDFVFSQQLPDGSWFTHVEGFGIACSVELHTCLALETLAHAGVDTSDPAVENGLTWLVGRQRPDGGWAGGPFPFPVTESYQGIVSPQEVFATAQVLAMLRRFAELEETP